MTVQAHRAHGGIAAPHSQPDAGRGLYLRERDSVIIVQEAGWVLVTVWTDPENLTTNGIRTPAHLSLSGSSAQRYPGRLTGRTCETVALLRRC